MGIDTRNLDNQLLETKVSGIGRYFMDNKSKFIDIHYAFEAYFKNVIKENHRKLKDVYLYAGYSESYGSKILSGEKHTTNRDVIIKLCVAGHFTLSQIDKALRLYGIPEF